MVAVENNIVPRKMDFPFDAEIPRYWFGGHMLGTQMSNALNLVFPMGERFFVRSVRHYLKDIQDDPQLVEQVQAFFAQEGHHAREHERFFAILRGQGYDIDPFIKMYRRYAWDRLEPKMHPVIRLSVTVALEHFTASFAENGLERGLLDECHPTMRDLLKWHAAEEIEHKSVAFDVLQKVDPRYRTRIAGLILATIGLLAFWFIGTWMLMKQDKPTVRQVFEQISGAVRAKRLGNGDVAKAFIGYLKPGFHPNQISNEHLSLAYLESIGRLQG